MSRGIAGPVAFVVLWAAGCGPSGTAVPTSATVHGRVINPTTALPIRDVSVRIGSTRLTTDEHGEFVVPNVAPSYDLVVSTGAGTYGTVSIAKGLTRRDPIVRLSNAAAVCDPRQGSLALTWSGSGATADAVVAWGGGGRSWMGLGAQPSGTGLYADVSWCGTETTQGAAHVLTYSPAVPNELPTSYGGFGSLMTTVSSAVGAGPGGGAVELSAVPSLSLTSTVAELPEGYVLAIQALRVSFSDGARLDLGYETLGGGTTFTDLVPVLPDSNIEIWGDAVPTPNDGSGSMVTWTGPTSASPVLSFRQPPVLLAPANWPAALPVDSELVWASSTPGASEVAMDCWSQTDDGSASLQFRVVTGASSVPLPDLAEFGLSYPPDAVCRWSVSRGSQLGDVDSYLGPAVKPPLPSHQTTEVSELRWFHPP